MSVFSIQIATVKQHLKLSKVHSRKKKLPAVAARIFGEIREPENETYLLARSYQQIGQLRVERDFLETSLGRRAGGVKQSAAIIRRFQLLGPI